ncbi:MAG: group II intron reverse transcriptase/maturase [Proteobacteria bacterium]|nr:group II intron reverse transcriptase/maturase [Pseudomonadota bacterium]
MGGTLRPQTILPGLRRIAEQARRYPEMVFNNVSHKINLSLLYEAHRLTRKSGSPGVDKVTAEGYARDLKGNIENLYERLRTKKYVAPPVERVWLDKEGGKKRPIGIPTFEDKIVQRAVTMVLQVIYDGDFYDFSHAYRIGHSPHQAMHEFREQSLKLNISWIIDADVSGFFDNLNHERLREIIKRRVNDGGIMRLIGKWLNAGVLEDGAVWHPEKGTPQGGVISPMLSNIYLHHVVDDWFIQVVQPRLKGRSFMIRFADDFIIGCELESDALKIMEVLPKRLGRFGLKLNPDKTKLIRFGNPSRKRKEEERPGTVNFLGLTFYWGKSRDGWWVIKKKTMGKRVSRFKKRLWNMCKTDRHKSLEDQRGSLSASLGGHYQYFSVRGNYKALDSVRRHATKAWRYWLSRRHRKGSISKVNFRKILSDYPLPKPRIIHAI